MKVLIIGAGGHAQVVADALLCSHAAGSPAIPIGYLDDDPDLQGQCRLGLPILGPLAGITETPHDAAVVAIGDNHTRRRHYETLLQRGEHFATVIHPRTTIASDVQIGPGSVVFGGVVVNTGSVIGANVILNTGCTVDHHNRVGDHAHIGPGSHLGGDVLVGAGVLVGIGATMLPQRWIGDWSVVGAGAVVTQDVPPHTVVVGAPARPLRCKDRHVPDTARPGSSKVVVYGAGGHGKTVVATIEAGGEHEIVGLLDDDRSKCGGMVYGYPVLGGREQTSQLRDAGVSGAVVAVGDNVRRAELALFLRENGLRLARVIHPAATILRGARIGEGTTVLPGAFVGADATVGEGCIVGPAAGVGHDCMVGSWVHVAARSWLGGFAKVGDYSLVGIGAVVLPYVAVGQHTVVGASAVVNRDLPDHVTAVGVPARILERRTQSHD